MYQWMNECSNNVSLLIAQILEIRSYIFPYFHISPTHITSSSALTPCMFIGYGILIKENPHLSFSSRPPKHHTHLPSGRTSWGSPLTTPAHLYSKATKTLVQDSYCACQNYMLAWPKRGMRWLNPEGEKRPPHQQYVIIINTRYLGT